MQSKSYSYRLNLRHPWKERIGGMLEYERSWGRGDSASFTTDIQGQYGMKDITCHVQFTLEHMRLEVRLQESNFPISIIATLKCSDPKCVNKTWTRPMNQMPKDGTLTVAIVGNEELKKCVHEGKWQVMQTQKLSECFL
jgi:hypothetical protein